MSASNNNESNNNESTGETSAVGSINHADSGKPLTRSFASVSEMCAYADERLAAALAYIDKKERTWKISKQ